VVNHVINFYHINLIFLSALRKIRKHHYFT